MKKLFWSVVAIALVAGAGARYYISRNAPGYVEEILEAYNRLMTLDANLSLKEYRGDWSGGVAKIALKTPEKERTTRVEVEYGPLFPGEMESGLIALSKEGNLSEWSARPAVSAVGYRYRGLLDFSSRLRERIAIQGWELNDTQALARLRMSPATVERSLDLETLESRGEFRTRKIELISGVKDQEERTELLDPRLKLAFAPPAKEGLRFGDAKLTVREWRLASKKLGPAPWRLGGEIATSLAKEGENRAAWSLRSDWRSLDSTTEQALGGIARSRLDLELSGLGIEGLQRAEAWRKRRMELQSRMSRALGRDPRALQEAILALDALEGEWVGIYNRLLIPGQTRLKLDLSLRTAHDNRLRLDLRYTGKPLPEGNPLGAIVALGAHADRLVEGSFSLEWEQKLLARLYPQAAMILDAMCEKGMATLEKGVYRLKGEIKGGKIIINGTRYSPYELAMLILL